MQGTDFRRYQVLVVFIALLALVLSSFGPASASDAQLSDLPVDQVAVKLKPGVLIGTILNRYNATLLGTIAETNFYFLQLPVGQTAEQLLPSLNADPDLFYAEPNYYADGEPGSGAIMFGARMAPAAEAIMFGARGDLTPTPSGELDQWAWNKIGLADARKISSGQGIIVAVLDTGLAANHPLLRSSIAGGYDFVGMKNDIYDTGNGLDDDGDGVTDEDLGHGTHVAGIIVTAAPGVQVMPIRVLNSDGVGTYWEVAAGIRYAVDHGAKIINMSMSAPRLTPSLADALAYASAHNVLVVAAAGTGAGPNYPAGYTNQALDVIGVGASDRDDKVAWFSGGQTAHTDVFAPGVDIDSAYPYDGYVLGSGTSMAAPMVAAEAALLMSRYPDWSLAQVTARVRGKTVPMLEAAVGRIDLSSALNTGLQIDYMVGDIGSINDNNLKPHIRLINNSPQNIPLNELKIRYWYTVDTNQAQTLSCDYASFGCANLIGTFTNLPGGSPNKTATADAFVEIGFTSSAGNLPGGGQGDLSLRINKNDWSNYNETNDYSYNESLMAFSHWSHITVYRNGVLVSGVEPFGMATPSATATPSPIGTNTTLPTATSTRTTTPAPSTATRTNTPAAPTATRTSTPIAPTATRTTAPAAACAVSYAVSDWGGGFTAAVTITNNSSAPINGWTLAWRFPGNQFITSSWSSSYTQSGQLVSFKNLGYNATIPAGGTSSFGFNANYSGANVKPSSFTLNGAACVVK